MSNAFTLVQVQPGVFQLRCTVCHGGYAPTVTGLRMAYVHQDASNCKPHDRSK
jgi:hypothetical protein